MWKHSISLFLVKLLLVMPFPVVEAAAIGAGLLSTGGQIMATGKTNRKTRQFQEKMFWEQRKLAEQDWNRVNAYNSPQQQMQRLKEAGLNPNLVYGSGGAESTASPMRSVESPQWNPETPNYAGLATGAAQALSAYQDYTLQQEAVKNMAAQRSNMELDSILKTIEVSGGMLNNKMLGLNYEKTRRLFDTSISQAEENLRATKAGTDIKISQEVRDAALHASNLEQALARVANIGADTELKKEQLAGLKTSGILDQMEIAMRKLGLSYNDSVILRMMAQFAEGKSLPELVKSASSQIAAMASDAWDNSSLGRALKSSVPMPDSLKGPDKGLDRAKWMNEHGAWKSKRGYRF